jgi:hypothetical protein
MKNVFVRAAFTVACLGIFTMTTAFVKPGTASVKTIKVVNKCSFNIDRIYFSDVEDEKWGDDILDENEVLAPGESVDVEIECGTWDVKLVADDGSTCEVSAVNVCSADIWNVTSDCGK